MALLYVSQKSKFSAKKGIKPYAKPKAIPAYAQGVYKPSKPFHRTTEQLPSVESTGYSCCAKKQDKVYTGDSIVGIGTMHKSNAVPIFTDQEAKDISSMRR
jgi:hypothetical protein